jgi:hypothetical protein
MLSRRAFIAGAAGALLTFAGGAYAFRPDEPPGQAKKTPPPTTTEPTGCVIPPGPVYPADITPGGC